MKTILILVLGGSVGITAWCAHQQRQAEIIHKGVIEESRQFWNGADKAMKYWPKFSDGNAGAPVNIPPAFKKKHKPNPNTHALKEQAK